MSKTQVGNRAYFWNLTMEKTPFSETSLKFYRTTRRHIPECSILNEYCCKNLKSNLLKFVLPFSKFQSGQ
jgi:hypothetical protein